VKNFIFIIAVLSVSCSPTAPKTSDCTGKWIYLGTDRLMFLTVTPGDSLYCRYYLPGDTLPVLFGRGTSSCYSCYRDSSYTLLNDSCAVLDVYRSGDKLVVSQNANKFDFTRE
jgi:hypothetical protein